MLTQLFNCPKCKLPFDCETNGPRRPVYYPSVPPSFWCRTCHQGNAVQRGLMEFLAQPAFKKVNNGYECNSPIIEPTCLGCQENIKIFQGCSAVVGACGHYLCQDCDLKRRALTNFPCAKCATQSHSSSQCLADSLLAPFASKFNMDQIQGLTQRFSTMEKEFADSKARLVAAEAKKETDRKNGALQECGDCGIEQPVERLLKCQDCKTILCGVCSFASHREHSVKKLLGIALVAMEKQNEKKYKETLKGLHGNLRYIQSTIDEAVEKVLIAGNDCLADVSKSTKYDDAIGIVARVDKAAIKFEQHCEVYIPVARELATRLTKLGEEIAKKKE